MVRYNKNFAFLQNKIPLNTTRIVALQGGTRSAKTYSTLQFIVDLCYSFPNAGMVISVVRDGWPSLAASALKDFKDILKAAGLYNESNESKPSGYYEYRLRGNVVEFFSVDNEQKVRGRKRDLLFINEANELTYEKYVQLAIRTTGRIIMDYNPSDGDGYIREKILTRTDVELLITTYKDNKFLTREQVAEIELLADGNQEYWNVFGLGLWGNVEGAVLAHHKVLLTDDWKRLSKTKTVYGLDFGYSAPSALVGATFYDEAVYLNELLYERKLTNTELIARVERLIGKTATIYADAAEPDRIQEFRNAGFSYIYAADKSIKDGLDKLRSYNLYITEQSTNLLKEAKQYRYEKDKKTGDFKEEPVAIAGDHAIDAGRYAVYSSTKHKAPNGTVQTPKPPTGNRVR